MDIMWTQRHFHRVLYGARNTIVCGS